MLTASELVRAISLLPRNRDYNYINESTPTRIFIDHIEQPEGPIHIRRYNPAKQGRASASRTSISTEMIWRVANAIRAGVPLNIDRLLGASYNTRSAFEALLAHTPQFYFCYPGRIESTTSGTSVKRGHKHLLWRPDDPHAMGVTAEIDTDIVISEIPSIEAVYDALVLPDQPVNATIDINMARRHAQIQVALVKIGQQLGFRTWVAQNDKGIVYEGQRLGEMEGVVIRLDDEKLIASYSDAVKAALLIDCIWFQNARLMPAVIEIEHSTGVTSGLTRMLGLYNELPRFPTRWVIAAADDEREKVVREANRPQFQSMEVQFFPYSAIEELYSLCQRRKIQGVTDKFLDSFLEPCLRKLAS